MADIYVTWDLADTLVAAGAVDLLAKAVPHDFVLVPRTTGGKTGTGMLEEHLALIREARLIIAFLGAEWEGNPPEIPPARAANTTPTHRDLGMALSTSIPVLPVLIGDTPLPRKLPAELEEMHRLWFARVRPDRLADDIANVAAAAKRALSGRYRQVEGALLERRIRNRQKEEVRATFMAGNSDARLVEAVHDRRLCLLTGEAGTGLWTSAVMCLARLATHVHELMVGPGDVVPQLVAAPFQPGHGYVLGTRSALFVGGAVDGLDSLLGPAPAEPVPAVAESATPGRSRSRRSIRNRRNRSRRTSGTCGTTGSPWSRPRSGAGRRRWRTCPR